MLCWLYTSTPVQDYSTQVCGSSNIQPKTKGKVIERLGLRPFVPVLACDKVGDRRGWCWMEENCQSATG